MAEHPGPWQITRTIYTTPKYRAIESRTLALTLVGVVLVLKHMGAVLPLVLIALPINFWLRGRVANDLVGISGPQPAWQSDPWGDDDDPWAFEGGSSTQSSCRTLPGGWSQAGSESESATRSPFQRSR